MIAVRHFDKLPQHFTLLVEVVRAGAKPDSIPF
jgi:hypothetical protein